MTITKEQNGSAVTLLLSGRLDTLTAPELEKAVQAASDAQSLVFDFANLDYISSAGLRVVIAAHKQFVSKGGLVVQNVNEMVRDVFEVTGFNGILTIR
ncbi:MAG: STAS domain-containing protein [Treponema sp.]|nr:STAS domain-containing protein [Treponema sp.]